jgi:hypothetical protein
MDPLGLFYVIDGFLDIFLPVADSRLKTADDDSRSGGATRPQSERHASFKESFPSTRSNSTASAANIAPSARAARPQLESYRPLFTVKRGGIAGYLGMRANAPLYCALQLIYPQPRYVATPHTSISKPRLIHTLVSCHSKLLTGCSRRDPLFS